LAENAIKAAIADYRSKQEKNTVCGNATAIVNITPVTIQHIKKMLKQRQPKALGVRFGVVKQACQSCTSNLSYFIDYVDIANATDEIIHIDGVNIYVDAAIIAIIFGTTIDYKNDNLQGEFIFYNTNEKKRCGCGRSFEI
jgi:iron-sulfur cluster assembly protein